MRGQRGQTIGALRLDAHAKSDEELVFYIRSLMKTTKPGNHQKPLEFVKYTHGKLCIIDCFVEYRRRTDNIRENLEGNPQELILSWAYPHKPVKVATIARYIKSFLGMAGVDITVFTAHSTRHASTSKNNNMGLSIKDIAKAAGWKSGSTFAKHYKLPIRKENFGAKLLSC